MTPAAIIELAATCAPNIHPQTLHSVIRQETGYNIYAIGINHAERLKTQPQTRAEAISIAKHLLSKKVNFDAGLAQINIKNLNWLSMSVEDLFDPCKNLKASSLILSSCYKRAKQQYGEDQQALRAALSCYNTGNFNRGFANGYVNKVVAQAQTYVPTPYVPAIELEAGTSKDNAPSKDNVPEPNASEPKDNSAATEHKDGDAFSHPDADAFTRAERQTTKQKK